MNTYKTIDIARIIGIHVNTVRLYEKCGSDSIKIVQNKDAMYT